MAFVRLIIIGAIACTVVYFSTAWYLRSVRRERLENEWDAANPDRDPSERAEEVEEGVTQFTQSLGYRALWLIYILPVLALLYLLVSTNWR